MIDDKITELKAKGMGLAVSNEELESKFKEHKDRFRTPEAFDDYLKRSGNTVENMKEDLKRNLLRDRVVEKLSGEVDVTDDEVKKYYDENVQRFTEREQVKASRVLVRLMPDAKPAEKTAALAEAKTVYAQLKKTGADFAAIAKEKSKGPEAANGGDLGWLTRGRMTPEFDLAVFGTAPEAATTPTDPKAPKAPAGKVVKGLEANEMTGVVETKLGYEIVKVFEKKGDRQRPLDEVKESIKNSLLARKKNEKRRDVLRALKADAKVEQLVKFDMPPMPQMGGGPGGAPPAPGTMPMPPGQGGATPMPQQALPAQVSPVPAQVVPAQPGGAPAQKQ
jgi:parvulin-like peptidyl-prolyl isomerase